MAFGSTSLTAKTGWNVFAAALDSSLSFKWAVAAAGTDQLDSTGIALSAKGEIFVSGNFTGSGTFGGISLAGQGADDIFVAKLSASGTWLWAQGAGGDLQDSGRGIVLTDTGRSAVVVGTIQHKAMLGPTAVTSKGSHDGFIWRQAMP